MLRDEGYSFLELGWMIERALITCRLLDVHLPSLAVDRYDALLHLLRSASALEAYRRSFQASTNPIHVATFLLQSPSFPRSVLFCLQRAETSLANIATAAGTRNRARRLLGRIRSELEYADPIELATAGLGSLPAGSPRTLGSIPAGSPRTLGSVPAGSPHPLGSVPAGSPRTLGSVPAGSPRTLGSIPAGSPHPLGSIPAGSPRTLGSVPAGSPHPLGSMLGELYTSIAEVADAVGGLYFRVGDEFSLHSQYVLPGEATV